MLSKVIFLYFLQYFLSIKSLNIFLFSILYFRVICFSLYFLLVWPLLVLSCHLLAIFRSLVLNYIIQFFYCYIHYFLCFSTAVSETSISIFNRSLARLFYYIFCNLLCSFFCKSVLFALDPNLWIFFFFLIFIFE